MRPERVVFGATIAGLVALLAVGVWLLSSTPGTLENEPAARLGPTRVPTAEIIVVHVDDGDSASQIGEKLENAGMIESARLFRALTSLIGVGDQLAPGDYEFERGEPTISVVRRISLGITASLIVTIPEGLRADEIGQLLEERGVVFADDFRRALSERYDTSFSAQLPQGASLEGFLFPATYGFGRGATAHDAVQQLLSAFDDRYQDSLTPAVTGTRSLYDVVTLASIIEREAQVPEERPLIGSVFSNRLEAGIPLQADPTVQYALGSDPASVAQFGYWKGELSLTDLAIDSPYNTYENPGLPPGPISNPGLDSLLAAAQPAQTNYLFFVARPDGSHAFAETLEEHQRNVCEIDPSRPEC